jgi:hypothetical protein
VLDPRRLEGGYRAGYRAAKIEESALEDARCHEFEDVVA